MATWAPGSMMAGGGRFNGRGGRGGGFMGGGRGGFGGGPMGRGGWGGTGNYQPRHVLFIHGLPPNMDETLLQQVIHLKLHRKSKLYQYTSLASFQWCGKKEKGIFVAVSTTFCDY